MDADRRNGRDRPSPSPSSDDDDDMETLISHADPPKPSASPTPRRRHRRAAFEIADVGPRIGRGICQNKKFLILLAVCIPVIAVVAYVVVDVKRISDGAYTASPNTGAGELASDRMREAELRALYLLRSQQVGLLRLWNRTLVAKHGSYVPPQPPAAPGGLNSSSNSSVLGNHTVRHDQLSGIAGLGMTVSFEEFRSALLEQIKLNREIQKVLLSTHQGYDASSDGSEDNAGDLLLGGGLDVCRKVEAPTDRRTIEWKPKKDRYLFAICVSGQMSNHLICLEKHMLFAALLGRVLVLGSPKFDYQYDRVIDIKHVNECFGRPVLMTFDEFAQLKKNKMRIDKFICYMADPPCYVDGEHAKRLKGLGLSLAKLEAAWPKSVEMDKRVANDIKIKFGCNDEVLAVGDLFYANVEEEWAKQPGGPLAHTCKSVIQPSRMISLTAERFIQTFLGGNFIALHFRRHGFLKFCNAKEESCFFPIPQAAECILRVVERANAPVIYLSTDAADSEINLLQSFLVLNDKRVPLVKRPGHNSAEKWDALLIRNHLDGDSQVDAMLDKTICAKSSVFIGSPGSTFTDDIFRLRKDWGTSSVCDENMCIGEQPNFIASNE